LLLFQSVPLSERVNTILGWMDLPESQQPNFYALYPHILNVNHFYCLIPFSYMELVDNAGHSYGPNSTQVADAISEVDAAIGLFVDGLEARNLFDDVNILQI
jgi:hypothetical protein